MPEDVIDQQNRKDFSTQLHQIYQARAYELRLSIYACIISNFFYQLEALKNLSSTQMIIMQSIYWIMTFGSLLMTLASYCRDMQSCVFYGYIILMFRNILRLYNFELAEATYII
jgi:hypothetical protein